MDEEKALEPKSAYGTTSSSIFVEVCCSPSSVLCSEVYVLCVDIFQEGIDDRREAKKRKPRKDWYNADC
jgi:hypothetical protein